MKITSIFNQYLETGGEALAVEAICASLSTILELQRCDFSSSEWMGTAAPASWRQALWMISNPKSLEKLRHLQAKFRADAWLLHNVFPVGSAAIYPEAKRLGVPVIQYVHNFRPFSVSGDLWANNRIAAGGLSRNYWQEIRYATWKDSLLKTGWLAFVLSMGHRLGWWRSVAAWIAISDFMKSKFVSAGVPPEKIFTLRHYWKPHANRASPSEGMHYLFLGRLTEAKGIRVLLSAWEILERRYAALAPKLLVAGDGPLRSFVVSRSERLRSVTYAGRLSNEKKEEALINARAVIVPSVWWEPLGLVVYEAYDYSKPVLAAASGGLPETIVEGETGLLHQPGDAAQLAEQVMELEASADKRQSMGRAARFWLERNADEATWQKRFIEIANGALVSGK